jgi:hypothetical protein
MLAQFDRYANSEFDRCANWEFDAGAIGNLMLTQFDANAI